MLQALRAIPLFKDLSDDDLESIAALLKQVSFAKGQTIFRQGDIGNAMYVVENGQVVVWDDEADQALAYLGPGSFVGEIALLLAEPRSASLKVAIDADLYVLAKDDFDRLLMDRPEIAIYMTRELSQRLVKTSKRRFLPKARRISALWGVDNGELTKTIAAHVKKPIAILPLATETPTDTLRSIPNVQILSGEGLSIEKFVNELSRHIEHFSHIILPLPNEPTALARKAISLADTVISIGAPPPWLKENVGVEKLWETSTKPGALSRVARRLTGHTVGLALSSGGGKGLAHLGVMKVLREENIPVDLVAGTSAGAFFGVHFAMGRSAEEIIAFADELQTYNRWINWDINIPPRSGLLKGAKAKGLIAGMVENRRFEDLDIPFFCVAADIHTGEEVVFHSGSLADAIRASLSIPILADPWHVNDRFFIDGAFVDPIPAELLRAKGADIVIASSVIQPLADSQPSPPVKRTKKPNFLEIISNMQSIVENQLVNSQLDAVDVMIHTGAQADHALDFTAAQQLIAAGEAAARAQLPAIQACLNRVSEQ